MGTLKILLRSIRSEEGPHYRLGEKRERESCHLTSNNQPLFTSWISSGDSILGLYCVAWLTQESVSSRIFVRKKGMSQDPSNGRSQQTLSAEGGKGKSTVVTLLPDSHERLAFEKPTHSVPEMWGRMYDVLALKKLVNSDFAKILKVATKIRETCEKTLFTPSSPVKATKLYRFCLSNKRSPKSPINV
jgi:hypothetical protein